MLHEILYALMGHIGDVIIFQDDKFIVNPALYQKNVSLFKLQLVHSFFLHLELSSKRASNTECGRSRSNQ